LHKGLAAGFVSADFAPMLNALDTALLTLSAQEELAFHLVQSRHVAV
jgi:hypothetical protein